MTNKQVVRNLKVELRDTEHGWEDVSELVRSFQLRGKVGGLYELDLHLVYDRNRIRVTKEPAPLKYRVAVADVITVDGVNLSDHCPAYRVVTGVGALEEFVITLQADSHVARINGKHPWEEVAR